MPIKYADSDFFLALIKDSDWLKERARKIYEEHKGEIYVSPFTLVELIIIFKREEINIKEAIIQISRIAKLEGKDFEFFYKVADFVQNGATIFDSLVMAQLSKEDKIISSDKIYEKFGFDVIDIKKKE